MLIYWVFAIFGFSGEVHYRGTGIYSPLDLRAVVVPHGDVFVLTGEKKIIHYNDRGEKIGEFAGRGQGPGELEAPLKIGYDAGKLWVFDFQRQDVNFYDTQGRFLSRIKYGGIGSELLRTEQGWVFARVAHGKEEPAHLYFLGGAMEKKSLLYQWTPLWMSPGKVYTKLSKKMGVNPAREFFRIQVGSKGRYLFLAHTGPIFRIDIFDMRTQRIARTVKRDIQPIPFNEAWGEEQVKASNRHSVSGRKLVLRAPEYFPLIRKITVTPENDLVVELWTGLPDARKSFRIFDTEGKDAALDYQPEHAFRILGVVGDMVYLKGYDSQQEEAIIIKGPKANLDQLAEHNPITYKSKPGIFIMID